MRTKSGEGTGEVERGREDRRVGEGYKGSLDSDPQRRKKQL